MNKHFPLELIDRVWKYSNPCNQNKLRRLNRYTLKRFKKRREYIVRLEERYERREGRKLYKFHHAHDAFLKVMDHVSTGGYYRVLKSLSHDPYGKITIIGEYEWASSESEQESE